MGNPSLVPETALQLVHILLYCTAYIFAGAALIGLSVYIVLVCWEMFFSQPRSNTSRAKVQKSARRVLVAEETLKLAGAETPILAAPEGLAEEVLPMNTSPGCAQMPTTVPVSLQSTPTGL